MSGATGKIVRGFFCVRIDTSHTIIPEVYPIHTAIKNPRGHVTSHARIPSLASPPPTHVGSLSIVEILGRYLSAFFSPITAFKVSQNGNIIGNMRISGISEYFFFSSSFFMAGIIICSR